MKKKILTAVAVCALSGACVFGATACNKDSGSSGGASQVTGTQWKAAFEKATALENVTIEATTTTYNGENKVREYISNVFFASDKMLTSSDYVLDNATDNESLKNVTVTGYNYLVKDGSTYYSVYNNPHVEDDGSVTDTWKADIEESGIDKYKEEVSFYFSAEYTATKDGKSSFIKDMFSAFTYADGAYTASLYPKVDEEGNTGLTAYDITVKFENGNISYYSLYTEEPEAETPAKYKEEMKLTKYGTTAIILPAAAQKSLSDFKAVNSKN